MNEINELSFEQLEEVLGGKLELVEYDSKDTPLFNIGDHVVFKRMKSANKLVYVVKSEVIKKIFNNKKYHGTMFIYNLELNDKSGSASLNAKMNNIAECELEKVS